MPIPRANFQGEGGRGSDSVGNVAERQWKLASYEVAGTMNEENRSSQRDDGK
jgi:hypothetical protein